MKRCYIFPLCIPSPIIEHRVVQTVACRRQTAVESAGRPCRNGSDLSRDAL